MLNEVPESYNVVKFCGLLKIVELSEEGVLRVLIICERLQSFRGKNW